MLPNNHVPLWVILPVKLLPYELGHILQHLKPGHRLRRTVHGVLSHASSAKKAHRNKFCCGSYFLYFLHHVGFFCWDVCSGTPRLSRR